MALFIPCSFAVRRLCLIPWLFCDTWELAGWTVLYMAASFPTHRSDKEVLSRTALRRITSRLFHVEAPEISRTLQPHEERSTGSRPHSGSSFAAMCGTSGVLRHVIRSTWLEVVRCSTVGWPVGPFVFGTARPEVVATRLHLAAWASTYLKGVGCRTYSLAPVHLFIGLSHRVATLMEVCRESRLIGVSGPFEVMQSLESKFSTASKRNPVVPMETGGGLLEHVEASDACARGLLLCDGPCWVSEAATNSTFSSGSVFYSGSSRTSSPRFNRRVVIALGFVFSGCVDGTLSISI